MSKAQIKRNGQLTTPKDEPPSHQENLKIYEAERFQGGKASVIICVFIINLNFRKKWAAHTLLKMNRPSLKKCWKRKGREPILKFYIAIHKIVVFFNRRSQQKERAEYTVANIINPGPFPSQKRTTRLPDPFEPLIHIRGVGKRKQTQNELFSTFKNIPLYPIWMVNFSTTADR